MQKSKETDSKLQEIRKQIENLNETITACLKKLHDLDFEVFKLQGRVSVDE